MSESGIEEENRKGDGSRTKPIQPLWDTMSEQEAFDRIPNNVFFVDPEGVTRFKGE